MTKSYIIVGVLLAILLIPSVYALSRTDYLSKIENRPGVISSYTIYEVSNPTWAYLSPRSNSDFNVTFMTDYGLKRQLDYKISEKVLETYYIQVPIIKEEENVVEYKNGTKVVTYESVITGWKTEPRYRYVWKESNILTKNFLPTETKQIKVEGFKSPYESVDNIVSFAGYTFNEYDWWNTSSKKCKNLTFTNNNNFDVWYNTSKPLDIDIDGITFQNFTKGVHIVSEGCSIVSNSPVEVEYYLKSNQSNGGNITIMSPNVTAANTKTYGIYYEFTTEYDPHFSDENTVNEWGNIINVETSHFNLSFSSNNGITAYDGMVNWEMYHLQGNTPLAALGQDNNVGLFGYLSWSGAANNYVAWTEAGKSIDINGSYIERTPFYTQINFTSKNSGNYTYTFYDDLPFIKVQTFGNNATNGTAFDNRFNNTDNYNWSHYLGDTNNWTNYIYKGTRTINITTGKIGLKQKGEEVNSDAIMLLFNVTEYQRHGTGVSLYLLNQTVVVASKDANAALGGYTGISNFTYWYGYSKNQSTSIVNESYLSFISNTLTYALGAEQDRDIVYDYNYTYQNESYSGTVAGGTSQDFSITVLINQANVVSSVGWLYWNGTAYRYDTFSENGRYKTFTKTLSIPSSETTTTVDFNWNLSFEIATGGYENTTEVEHTQTITGILITNCSSDSVNETIMWLFLRDEENTTQPVNGTLEALFIIPSSNTRIPINFTQNQTAFRFCISPGDESIVADVDIEYDAVNYSKRNYYFRNTTLVNTSMVNRTLYMLDDNYSSQIKFEIKNTYGIAQEDVILQIQRYFLGTDEYRLVAMTKSGYDGTSLTYLKSEQWYRYVLVDEDGVVVGTKTPTKLTQSELTVYTDYIEEISMFEYYDKLAYNCTYNNGTRNVVCTFSDSSGHMTSVYLYVTTISASDEIVICSKSSTSSSTTLVCNVSTYVGNSTIQYYIYADFSSSPTKYLIDSGFIDLGTSPLFGDTGVFITILVLMVVALTVLWSPSLMILLEVSSLVLMNIAGFFVVGWGFMMAIIFAGAILIYILSQKGS